MSHVRSAAQQDRRRLAIVFVIGLAVLVLEVGGAFLSGSLALLADAGHVASDVTGIALALGAIWLAGRPATATRTFGWYRAEILAALLNALLLLALAVFIVWQSLMRLSSEPVVASGTMLLVAAIGAAANAASLWLLKDAQARSLNMRGAYLEVLGDLAGSVLVVIAALVVGLTGFSTADTVASLLIAVLIVPRALRLMREALDVLLEAAPRGLDMDEVRGVLLATPGVEDVHDLHAWTLTSGLPVLSAHVVVDESVTSIDMLDRLCGCLSANFDVDHSTIQLERRDRRRQEQQAHR
jgi:cobalt-zinc-cadmium efflux system protein